MQDDGVIIVHSGVYDEQLSISKPVAVIGAGAYTCILPTCRRLHACGTLQANDMNIASYTI